VKAFVVQDIPLYHNLVMKHIPGADPELVLLNHYYEELDRIALSDMSRSEINELLGELGFYKKTEPEDEVPEEFRFSPAKDSPFKDEPPYKSSVASLATDNASSEPKAEAKHTDL
uniref:Selenoprotein M n=2 Tax=Cyclopterus lumpus TaxID=8103 RepID=A0A8C2Z4D7_CYCLU